jgi:hypothetical protein
MSALRVNSGNWKDVCLRRWAAGGAEPIAGGAVWTELCPPLFSLLTTLNPAFVVNRAAGDQAKKAIPQFRNVVQAVATPNKQAFDAFAAKVKID